MKKSHKDILAKSGGATNVTGSGSDGLGGSGSGSPGGVGSGSGSDNLDSQRHTICLN